MPQQSEELYCHQQICIPPTFPYLLRQYAKAAIRSQPTDLLKWSTAYFRCLALNVPPPVKPRLEYPIPRDYLGITPGWLRALNYQLQNCKTVNFKVLWDRWMGSCIEHNGLLQALCLGGFSNPERIPWNKFLGICAGFLNDNLTQSMIMFCEIITEQPEGGSAMVPLESFLEVYQFLAMIDASQPQILPNLYFTDDFLDLEPKVKKAKRKRRRIELSVSVESSIPSAEEVIEEQEIEESIKGESSVISCPDIASDEALKERDQEAHDEYDEPSFMPGPAESGEHFSDEVLDDEELMKDLLSIEKLADEEGEDQKVDEEEEEEEQEEEHRKKPGPVPREADYHDDDHDDFDEKELAPIEEVTPIAEPEAKQADAEVEAEKHAEKKHRKIKDGTPEKRHEPPDEAEVYESDESVTSSDEGEHAGYDELDELERAIKAEYAEMAKDEEETAAKEEVLPEEEEERKIEEVSVPAVPGIGPKVPDDLVDAVQRHLKRVSAVEHGMTMPRHVRHLTCPPLEVLDYTE